MGDLNILEMNLPVPVPSMEDLIQYTMATKAVAPPTVTTEATTGKMMLVLLREALTELLLRRVQLEEWQELAEEGRGNAEECKRMARRQRQQVNELSEEAAAHLINIFHAASARITGEREITVQELINLVKQKHNNP